MKIGKRNESCLKGKKEKGNILCFIYDLYKKMWNETKKTIIVSLTMFNRASLNTTKDLSVL